MTPPKPRPVSLEHTTYLALLQAHETLGSAVQDCLKAQGLSEAQFNVLRILLRGSAGACSCQEIGDELLKRVPDVTRLLDRMERDGLVTRERSTTDRRVVHVRCTPEGRRRAEALYEPLAELHARQFSHLSQSDVEQLNHLLRTLFDERGPRA